MQENETITEESSTAAPVHENGGEGNAAGAKNHASNNTARLIRISGRKAGRDFMSFAKNLIFAVVLGLGIGAYSAVFGKLVNWATDFRTAHEWLLFLLPVGGLVIVLLYKLCRVADSRGTNRVLESISANETLKPVMAPLITVGTFITHLLGGSAGREGAALQIGGCIGENVGRIFKLEHRDLAILTMCGMSAAFSALFGTPLTAMIFSMEVISIGIMHYSAIVPCAVSAVIAKQMAVMIGLHGEDFSGLVNIGAFDWFMCLKTAGFGILCALLSMLFCMALHKTEHYYKKIAENQYLRIVLGGVLVIVVTMLVGSNDYQGAGMNVIEAAIGGHAVPYAFALKIILTALTIGAGFKGGEIIPTIFVGATFGCVVGPLIGIPASVAAALGVCGLFCGVTNCPLASLALSFELFGFQGVAYFLIVAAISYRLSGYYGLYTGQKIVYSKSMPLFINRNTRP